MKNIVRLKHKNELSSKTMIGTTTETVTGGFSDGLNWTRIAVGLFSTSKDMILDACRHTDGKNRTAKCSDQIQPEVRDKSASLAPYTHQIKRIR